jgi:GNAT superfamily N-acetyltransferase
MTKDLYTNEPDQQFGITSGLSYPNTPQMRKIRDVIPTLEDAGRLADCVNEWSDDDSWGGGFGDTEFTAERIFKEWFTYKFVRQMVVEEEGIIQGYCSVDGHWTDVDTIYAILLGVRPSQQKRGFGKGLLLKAVETTAQHGKNRLDLHTWAGNLRAVPVYKKTGFMWCPKTSALMENFIPAILNTHYFKSFFSRNDWYEKRELSVTQKPDEFEKFGMKAYFYHFIQDSNNSLIVYIDRHAKEISGFLYVENGEELSVQLIPNLHEVFIGIETTTAKLKIENKFSRPIRIRGSLKPFKGIKTVSINVIDELVQAGTEVNIPIEVELNPEVETYILDQVPWKRTDCRLYGNFLIDDKEIQLAVGWVPQEPFQVVMSESTAYFGTNTQEITLPIGFRNMTELSINGRVEITGDGLSRPYEVHLDSFKSGDTLETHVKVQRPKSPTVSAWRWKIQFYQQKSSGEKALHPIVRHVSCFTQSGVVAYINPHKEAVIENELLRFQFHLKEANELEFVKSRDVGEFPFRTFGISVGKPFPAESSEFWRLDRPFEIIEHDSKVSFKQVMLSKTEKPGLRVTRWIDVGGGKPFISSWYELTNTSDQKIENIAIRHWSPWRTPNILLGKYILPLKSGWLVSDDPEFNDSFDFPQNTDEYAEPWIAKEHQLGFGCGVIWDPTQVETIRGNPFSGPMIDTKTYTLQPGETIKLGHFTWVFGRAIAHLTRETWVNECKARKTTLTHLENKTSEYCKSILQVRCGQDLSIPGVAINPLPGLNWLDVDSKNSSIEVLYQAHRETPIEAQIDLKSPLWDSPIQWKMKLESGTNKQIKKEIADISNLDSQIYAYNGTIQLPYTSRPIIGALVPFRSSKKVTLEKKGDSWLFSNSLLSFQTSPTHGASLYSGGFSDNEDLFFSRYPNRESFVWFNRFVGGFHPFLKPSYYWNDWLEFLDNVWSDPIIVENDHWFGLSYQLDSPVNDFRLKDIACKITYYTRPESPLLWSQLVIKNNSGMSATIGAGFFLFLKPIEELITKRHNDIWIYRKTEKERVLNTIPPDNWVVASFGEEKILFLSPDPKNTLRGDYVNANNYSEMMCFNNFHLSPRKEIRIDTMLLFNYKTKLDDFLAIVNQRREFIHK